LELPNDKNREISEEEIGRKLARLGDIGELADKTDYPFDRESIEALARLVIKLEDKLPDYDAVLSDEASGRLPSLFLRKIINHAREKAGLDPARIYFLAGGRHHNRAKNEAMKNFLAGKKGGIEKALMVTEFIRFGDGIMGLMESASEAGIDFDLAVVSSEESSGEYVRRFGKIFKKAVYGRESSAVGLAFYGQPFVNGVVKDGENPSPHPEAAFSPSQYEKLNRSEPKLKQAREGIDFLAEEFYKLLD